ncbi:MAG: tRNA (adenosine(37)-N6)-threonylcarbamoyltransferase complex transferase subunit TsaD [Desulfatiglans sp.]|jgi:N6-L-threonylcarbamoyladenine synthase|nr:tRNA (adenosine(37)-N6)-threonylcarbamoyltransferase complex transferase subunit TsaD [Desulfatiglans sp.]
MKILGIDTSCDDTSAAVITDGNSVISNVIHSQIKLHNPYGGVVPELASREHIRNIVPVVDKALANAGLKPEDINAIAVTIGPGLIGSLLVGLYYAKSVAYFNKIPLVAVNHLEGHILSILLEEDHPDFPFTALTVSGGHTSLYFVKAPGDYELMGQTLDDAAGEAFDKVAKLLGLGYPGGAIIEAKARSGRSDAVQFPRAYISDESLDFSFSGLKTAVALYIDKWEKQGREKANTIKLEDIAASFQEAVFDVLIDKLIMAGKKSHVSSLVLAGGVACNRTLREKLTLRSIKEGFKVFFPMPAYCTDNGAMIALAGFFRAVKNDYTDFNIDVRSRFPVKDIKKLK